jgi:hypothetical protein
LLFNGEELLANSAELLFAIENDENISVEVELSEFALIDDALGKINTEIKVPNVRLRKIEILKVRKFLLNQQQMLIRAINIALHEPVLSFLQMKSYRLALVLRGLGELLFEESMVPRGTVLLDLWHKSDRRISTIVRTFPESEKESKHYHHLIGEGWDLYDIYEKTRYERAIPAIIIKYISLLDDGKLENPESLLDLHNWYVGLR